MAMSRSAVLLVLSLHAMVGSLVMGPGQAQSDPSDSGGCLAELMTIAGIPLEASVRYEKSCAARQVPFAQISRLSFFQLRHDRLVVDASHAAKVRACVLGGACLSHVQCSSDGTCTPPSIQSLSSAYTWRCEESKDGYKGCACKHQANPKGSPKGSAKQCESEETRITGVQPPRHCLRTADNSASAPSGVYQIDMIGSTITTYCDMQTDGGGWVVFQRRRDGSVDFDRDWSEYRRGFGLPDGEFWLGLERLHQLTASGRYELRVDMIDRSGRPYYAKYPSINVAGESDKYRLTLGGEFCGNISGPFLTGHDGQPFSTKDRDNDNEVGNCAQMAYGGGWYNNCYTVNMNGKYGLQAWGGLGVWELHGEVPYLLHFLEFKIRKN